MKIYVKDFKNLYDVKDDGWKKRNLGFKPIFDFFHNVYWKFSCHCWMKVGKIEN